MSIDWPRLGEIIDQHDRFLITTHNYLDGDAIGSELAMRELLTARGKQVCIVNPGPVPPRYRFLDPEESILTCEPEGPDEGTGEVDAVIILDTGAWSQLGNMADFIRHTSATKAVLDHHVEQDDGLGAELFVDSSAEATGSMVFEAFEQFEMPLNEPAATALFVAVAMDTGWFKFEKTTGRTFRIAARLAEAGADAFALHLELNMSNRPQRLRLLGHLLDSLEVGCGGRLVHACIRREDFEQTGARLDETEDLIQHLQSIRGVEVAVLLIQKPGGEVKASFRSHRLVDCSVLASSFGGGGHRAASGATLEMSVEDARQTVLEGTTRALNVALAAADG